MRALLPLVLVCAAVLPARAEEAVTAPPSSATVKLAPATPEDQERQRAIEMDRLFGQLRRAGAENAPVIAKKIEALWTRNDSPTAELLLTQATRAMTDGEVAASESILDTLLGTYPDYVEALNTRAELYMLTKRYDDALDDSAAVLEQEPRHFDALMTRGLVFLAQDKPSQAVDALREALTINPGMDDVRLLLKTLENKMPNI